jgi:SAM-dependent methyltransferase
MTQAFTPASVDVPELRTKIQLKYAAVAATPEEGFHFHMGRPLAAMLDYPAEIVDRLPDEVVESFAGVNNPFAMGDLHIGETVLDVGSGAGFDSILAARLVGPTGRVVGVDMTAEMRAKAKASAALVGATNVEFVYGLAESLPLADESVDVVISNGAINLCPDKLAVYQELSRVLRPGGRLQIADVVVQRAVSESARANIDLWTG